MRYLFDRLPYAAMWLWVIVPVLVYVGYHMVGSPHMIWSYRFHDNGNPWDLSVARTYTSCTYVGWGGNLVTTGPREGKCGWVRFFHLEDAQ